MSSSDILLRHTVDRVRADVAILIETGHLNYSEAQDFLARLPNTSTNSAAIPPASRILNAVPAPTSSLPRAKALWPYNEQRTEPDLSFSIGDIIEITEQTNDDWWKGRVNGREGLFPSNHVELLEQPALLTMPTPEAAVARNMPPAPSRGKKPYKAFGASLHGTDTPPAVGATNSVGLQQAAGQEEKKNKYGNLKNTMATSAAGGVGFGAGAAIGGGLVRAIF